MIDQIKILQKPLEAHEIDFRIQSINRGGYATILAYKDARADMKRLDEAFTPLGWQRDYKEVGKLLLCGVSILNGDQWVTKWDTGTESNAEALKGLASDAFKRACFNLGIGRELYDYPVISIKLIGGSNENGSGVEWFLNEKNKDRYGKPSPAQGWGLNLKDWRWFSQFDDSGTLTFLGAKDGTGNLRFSYGTFKDTEKKAA